jgi:hypothetical protein
MYFMVQGQTEIHIPQMVSSIPIFAAPSLAALRQAEELKKESRYNFTFQFFPVGAFPGHKFTQITQSPQSE